MDILKKVVMMRKLGEKGVALIKGCVQGTIKKQL